MKLFSGSRWTRLATHKTFPSQFCQTPRSKSDVFVAAQQVCVGLGAAAGQHGVIGAASCVGRAPSCAVGVRVDRGGGRGARFVCTALFFTLESFDTVQFLTSTRAALHLRK